jgi:hypothetical protein
MNLVQRSGLRYKVGMIRRDFNRLSRYDHYVVRVEDFPNTGSRTRSSSNLLHQSFVRWDNLEAKTGPSRPTLRRRAAPGASTCAWLGVVAAV